VNRKGKALDRFGRDLEILFNKIHLDLDKEQGRKLMKLKARLERLYRQALVKINHSVMELICAKYLIKRGYSIDAERTLDEALVCDLYCVKGDGVLIVEVETGFTPPEHALDPHSYNRARIASKIARYSKFSGRFGLATPAYNILQIPPVFIRPSRQRADLEVEEVKNLCDKYYTRPPMTLEEIQNARLQVIYVLDVDNARVLETDPQEYDRLISSLPLASTVQGSSLV